MAIRSQADISAFSELVATRSPALLRTAYLVVGDHQLAHDLLQEALVKAYVAWPRLRDVTKAEAYVRRTMVTTAISWRRRRSFHERPVDGGSRGRGRRPGRAARSPRRRVGAGVRPPTSATRGPGPAVLRGPVLCGHRGGAGLFGRHGGKPGLRGPGQAPAAGRPRVRGPASRRRGGDPMNTLREAFERQAGDAGAPGLDLDELVGLGEHRLRRRRLTAVAGPLPPLWSSRSRSASVSRSAVLPPQPGAGGSTRPTDEANRHGRRRHRPARSSTATPTTPPTGTPCTSVIAWSKPATASSIWT